MKNHVEMAQSGQVLDMTPLGMKFTVLKSAEDTGGASLDLHWELLPGCNMKDPLVHIHPEAIETYEVLEGEMEFYVKDKWVAAQKGFKLTVPKGVPHTFRNPTENIVKVYNTHQPAFNMEGYFEDVCEILNKVTDNRENPLKMNLKTKLYMGLLMGKFRKEIIATNPPDMVIKILGLVAKLIGLDYEKKATH